MKKPWKILKKNSSLSVIDYFKILKKKKIITSFWIDDIIKNKKNNFKITNSVVKVYRLKVKNLGFYKATCLKKIYNKIIKLNYQLVPFDIALRLRLEYKSQKVGEWLRVATDMKSLIDSDNVPHLPKLGKALNKYFLETYWAYPGAVFHPHNEFVVCKYDI